MTKIQPLEDRVLIEPLSREAKTKGGIVLPDTADERPEQGTVMAVGPGKINKDGKLTAPPVKVGDVVLFTKYGPDEIKIDGKEYLVCKADNILAIIK